MNVPINRHVNVDGLNAAFDKSNKVKPSLHYLSLPLLLSEFCKHADLGSVTDGDDDVCVGDNVVDNNSNNNDGDRKRTKMDFVPATDSKRYTADALYGSNHGAMRNKNQMYNFPPDTNRNPMRMPGDFSGDLLPSGIPAPGFANPPSILGREKGGNLMGMNDPYFQGGTFDGYSEYGEGGTSGDLPRIGGLGMQPRFDPFYPPGVNDGGTGRGMNNGRGGRGGRAGRGSFSGDPNPDHQRPPSNLGRDMFM